MSWGFIVGLLLGAGTGFFLLVWASRTLVRQAYASRKAHEEAVERRLGALPGRKRRASDQ